MFEYAFMRHALLAILLASVIAAPIGYFLVTRRLAFAAHGLGHISFTGATLALWLNTSIMLGQLAAGVAAAIFFTTLEKDLQRRDTVIAVVIAFMLGLGVLFLSFYQGAQNAASSLLFGDVLGISMSNLKLMTGLGAVALAGLAVVLKPLLFVSLMPDRAQAKGLSTRLLGFYFMLLVAIAVTVVNQIVGVLFVFTLLIGPAAIGIELCRTFWSGMVCSIAIAAILGFLALLFSYYIDWPVSAALSILVLFAYLLAKLISYRKEITNV